MRTGFFKTGLAACLCWASATAAAPPADPLADLLRDWLAAFNSRDEAVLKRFYAERLGDDSPMFALENAADSCGFAVEGIEARSATGMTVLLRQLCLPGLQRAKLTLPEAPGGPAAIEFTPLALPGHGGDAVVTDIAERMAARDEFAGALIIARGGRPEIARGWGLADPEGAAPITPDTPMLLASAGKMFTAVAVLRLVEAGRIELDAPIGRYLPDYPNAETAKVTIRQLLNHRGGTGDIGILGRDDGANRARVRDIDDLIALNGARAPDFPPGSKTDYSNYGFVLLGAVIERVTGDRFAEHIATEIFAPAGMTRSGFPDRDHLDGVATGMTRFFGAEPKLVSHRDVLPWRGGPAGGGVSTANDLLRFFTALREGKLLSPAMLAQATSPGETPWYGLGFVVNSGADRSFGHGGNSYGMDVAAHHYAREETSFICLATRDKACNRLIFAWFLRTFPPKN